MALPALLDCAAGRRASKLISTFSSCFTGNYVRLWQQFMGDQPLLYTPVFDGRAVCYPNFAVLRDYLSWRQADTHINNQVRACCGDCAAAIHPV